MGKQPPGSIENFFERMALAEVDHVTPKEDLPWRNPVPKERPLPSTATPDGADKAYSIIFQLLSRTLFPQNSQAHLRFLDALFYIASSAELDQVLPELQRCLIVANCGEFFPKLMIATMFQNMKSEYRRVLAITTQKLYNRSQEYSQVARDVLIMSDCYATQTAINTLLQNPQFKLAHVSAKEAGLLHPGQRRIDQGRKNNAEKLEFIAIHAHYTDLFSTMLGHMACRDGELKRGAVARAAVSTILQFPALQKRVAMLQQVLEELREYLLTVKYRELLEHVLDNEKATEQTLRAVNNAMQLVEQMEPAQLGPHFPSKHDPEVANAEWSVAFGQLDRLESKASESLIVKAHWSSGSAGQ